MSNKGDHMVTIHQLAAQAIRQNQEELAESIVARQYALQPEVWERFGAAGLAKSVRDQGYHLTYLSEALTAGEPALFNEYLAWARVFFAGLKFREDVLQVTLETTRQVLEEMLPRESKPAALEYLDIGVHSLISASTTLESFIENGDNPLAGLARRYIDALLRGDRPTASRMILESAGRGMSIKDIYLDVFQRSQREIGRLWQTNQVSVAQEHYCTAATQMIMSQLYPYIFASERKGRCMVVSCVGGELHEIGARMVADFFEMEGWDTYFLGANTPKESVLRTIAEREPDVLAVSATMTFHIDQVSDLIAEFHRAGLDRRTKVLAGGYPFNIAPGLWKSVGADGYALDARQALEAAERLLG
jgi:MerR family transcriptional regulator, light-induced transcriptional regulator